MRHLVVGASLALAVIAAACGSDARPTATSTPATSAPPATSPPTATDPATPATDPATPSAPLSAEQIVFRRIATVHGALDIAHRSGDDTMFVVSRDGFVAAVRNATVADGHVLDISSIIVSGNEQGLLGMAFAADGEHAYVDYTDRDGNTVIAEFAVGSNGTFDPASRRELLTINQPYPNHNGGAIRFGPDGLLYIGMGDGGSGGDPDRRALDTGDLLGKILRIDPTPSAGRPYTIPADNPFINVPGARPEIWSIGLRNPWRFNFDRTNGDLWIADVGQDQWEEIDVATASTGAGRGANFGWSAFEGTHRFNEDQPADGVTMPIFEYPHGSAGCSIAGGVRYRGSAIPSLVGWYVFGDYCSGRVQALQVNADNTAGRVVDLGADVAGLAGISQAPNGELYVLSVETGNVFAVQPVS